MIGNGSGYASSSSAIWTWEIRNPDINAGFYVTQQSNSRSRDSVTFSANIDTSEGLVTVPNVNLDGRQSKMLVTDYTFGKHTLLYSSADILIYGIFDVDVLVSYSKQGQTSEFALKNVPAGSAKRVFGTSEFTATATIGRTTVDYTQGAGQTVLKFDGVLIYLLEQKSAWRFWAPPTTKDPDVKPNEQIFILGPYLVRSAYISHVVMHVFGDNDHTTTIEVYIGNSVIQTIDWNGIRLKAMKTSYGSVTADIPGIEDRKIDIPPLKNWRSADSLPEADLRYDDSKWIVCNKTTTLSPVAHLTEPVLFSNDYGYYTGTKVYRGYFDGANYSSLNVTRSGGLAFGWSAWLNGGLIGGNPGNASLTTTNTVISLSKTSLKETNNLFTVVVDYHGHDQTSTAKGIENPQGILGASLIGSSANYTTAGTGFRLWKIQGNAGGSVNLDSVRGPMNERGLYGERLGWHLPGFIPSSIEFYTTTFHMNIDLVPLGIELSAPANTIARVMIWVNGYQYGKYVPHLGRQTRFPIPPGIINNQQ